MKRFPIAAGLGFFLVSCGAQQPAVKNQASAQVAEIKYPNFSKGYLLDTNGKTHTNYEGALLFWRTTVKADEISTVLKQSKEIKIADSAYKQIKFIDDPLADQEAISKKRLAALDEELSSGSSKKIASFYQLQSPTLSRSAAAWFASHLPSSSSHDFSLFCDAQLWRLALADLVIKRYPFSARPSPAVICESYYAAQHYFEETSCQAPAAGTSKDYFSCFWKDKVVFKTAVSFVKKMPGNSSGAASLEEINAGENALISLAEGQQDLSEFYEKSLLMRDAFNKPLRDTNGKPYRLALQFEQKTIKTAVESPLAALLEPSSIAGINELFAARRSSSGRPLSLHDRLFVFHLIDSSALPLDRQLLPEFTLQDSDLKLLQNLGEFPREVFGKDLPNYAEQQASLGEEKKQLTATLLELHHKRSKLDELMGLNHKYSQWMQKRSAAADFIMDQHLVDAMYPRILLTLTTENNLVEVVLDFDYINPLRKLRGCFNLSENRQQVCPRTPANGETYADLAINLDQSTTLMKLSIPLTQPALFGFSEKTSDKDKPAYQVWSAEELTGKRLLLELYPRNYDEHLALLTGKVALYDGENEFSQGSATLTQHGNFP